MNGNICSGGSHSLSAKVTTTSKRIISLNTGLKYIRISNLSDKYVYITPSSKTSGVEAKVGTGIVLAPKGTSGWFIEFNNNSMFYCDFHAIVESGEADLALLLGY